MRVPRANSEGHEGFNIAMFLTFCCFPALCKVFEAEGHYYEGASVLLLATCRRLGEKAWWMHEMHGWILA